MDDYEVENILDNEKPKKIKSGNKGKRVERDLVKLLNSRFEDILSKNPSWGQFSRSVGSGNRWGQVSNLPQHAKDTFSGDLTIPLNFKFVVESKGGYNDVDLCCMFDGGVRQLDVFLTQVSDDSIRCNRKPILIWKKDRKPRLSFLLTKDMPKDFDLTYAVAYREWTGVSFANLLEETSNDFWFTSSAS